MKKTLEARQEAMRYRNSKKPRRGPVAGEAAREKQRAYLELRVRVRVFTTVLMRNGWNAWRVADAISKEFGRDEDPLKIERWFERGARL